MNETSLKALEYDKLAELVSRFARTPMGRTLFEDLMPLPSRRELDRQLRLISETIALAEEKQVMWSLGDLEDPAGAVSVLRISGAALEPVSMLELVRVCNQAIFARSSIAPEKEFAPAVWQVVEAIPPALLGVIEQVNRKLLPSGEVDDSASPELTRLRREINAQRGRLQKSLEAAMRQAGDAIQDAIVTQRNDRYVIPVKSDFRGKVGGVAHGFSSSGATVFVEPLDAIEANNELQNLKGKEEREVARILFSLTEELRGALPAVEAAVAAVAELDFVAAKVEFARAFSAVVPDIAGDGTLELEDARHPLLEESLRHVGERVVPVSFALTPDSPVMIISGANAGGKTVVLKTAGLLALMAVSGLPVTAKAARIPFYRSVLADIGDHQSLAANLSTFSSHVSNIASMMDVCSPPALVLLDEVGTGTDPDEGSALGVAVVDFFRRECGAQVIASTHYRGLKMYAANDEGVVNASVEFDEKTLRPTYRLLVGLAGVSSGIEIARRFGIREDVIAAARRSLGDASREAEAYLIRLASETRLATDLRAALEEEREETARRYALLDIEAGKREKERRREFEREMARALEEFDRQSRAFLGTIEDKALRNRLEKERLARKAELNRAVLAKVGRPAPLSAESGTEASAGPAETGPLAVGSAVATGFGIGRIEKISGDTAEVLVGSMRLREKLSALRAAAGPKSGQTRGEKLRSVSAGSGLRLDTEDRNAELNLIGKTTAEAEYEIDRFLDESYMAAVPRVRIIHGFGTGALKNFVHHFLKGHPHVERFGFAPQDQGGNGATVAELKQ